MKTAAEYLAEVAHLRRLALLVTDETALTEIRALIREFERLARELGNGSADP